MRTLRGVMIGFVLGAVLIGAAGVGIGSRAPSLTHAPRVLPPIEGTVAAETGARLPAGHFLAGAAKVSIAPDPTKWKPDVPEGTCSRVTPDPGCLDTFDMRMAKSVRQRGVWARATAISNGTDTIVLAVLDVVGWFYSYPTEICADCGSLQIRAAMGAELGIPAGNLVLASTHTHASGNTLGSIPSWYYQQVRDAAKQAMREAHAGMRPAVIDVGSTTSRYNNQDRRIISRAVPDYEVQWLRAVTDDAARAPLAVIYNFAAHTTVLASNDTLHSGYPGAANERLEQTLGGGVAMFFASGLGDQKVVRSRGIEGLGFRLADVILRDMQESPRPLRSNDIRADVRDIAVPGDNLFLLGARAAGVFVRDILPPAGGGPSAGKWGKSSGKPSCVGGGPLTVTTTVGGFALGEAAIMLAPGEIFSSISLVVKDYLENAEVVFVLALSNDQLGYMIPYNQFDETAHQGPGLAANSIPTSEYEEVLSLGRCVGEQMMDELVRSGKTLGFVP